jgi:hypothetical protein
MTNNNPDKVRAMQFGVSNRRLRALILAGKPRRGRDDMTLFRIGALFAASAAACLAVTARQAQATTLGITPVGITQVGITQVVDAAPARFEYEMTLPLASCPGALTFSDSLSKGTDLGGG